MRTSDPCSLQAGDQRRPPPEPERLAGAARGYAGPEQERVSPPGTSCAVPIGRRNGFAGPA